MSAPIPHYCIFMDGDKVCAVWHDFINLQESPAGFGNTPNEAIEELGRARKHPTPADPGDGGGEG